MFDKNAAIEAYSAPFGNKPDHLRDYCHETRFSGDVELLAKSIRQIQDAIFDEIWRRSETQPLMPEEMESVARDYLAEHEPWVNDRGVAGLLQWIAWMSWHEGCVRLPTGLHHGKNTPDEN
jgi:hypothetical protein